MSSPSSSRVRDNWTQAEEDFSHSSSAEEEEEEQVVVFEPPAGRIVNNTKYLMTERYALRPLTPPYHRVPNSESDVDLEQLLQHRTYSNLMAAWRSTGFAEYDKVLGTGGFASVYSGFRYRDRDLPHAERMMCAIKRLPCYRQRAYYHPDAGEQGFTYKSTKVIWDEVVALRCLCHTNIIRVAGVYLFKPKKETDSAVYIVMDYCDGGSLRDEISAQETGAFPEPVARFYFKQVISAVMYMHGKGLSHGDLHQENVMMRYKFDGRTKKCVVTDFGLASICWSRVSPGGEQQVTESHTLSGTVSNMSPDMVRKVFRFVGDVNSYTVTGWQKLAADVWSLGILLCRMLTNKPPSSTYGSEGLEHEVEGVTDQETQDFLTQMFARRQDQRPTVDQVYNDVWMSRPVSEPGLPAEGEII